MLSRAVIDALLPPGSIWAPEPGGDLDKLLDGIAGNHERARLFLASLADLRNPLKTPILPDLEREFGILPDTLVNEQTRRGRLLSAKTSGNGDGGLEFMQSRLRAAGFDVSVFANSPPVNPASVIQYGSSTIMGNSSAMFGQSMFGAQTGELLVNGPLRYLQDPVEYEIPADPNYWPLVAFIGADVERDGSGAITRLLPASVPLYRRQELARLIVKFKPLHLWVGMQIQYV